MTLIYYRLAPGSQYMLFTRYWDFGFVFLPTAMWGEGTV